MPLNARAKGANGERELCSWLHITFKLAACPKRNLEQVRNSGADIICQPFAFECKRVENLDLLEAWFQILRAVGNPHGEAFGLEPIVAFRKNKTKWQFLISAKHIGIETGFVQLTEVCFVKWVNKHIQQMNADYERIRQQQNSAIISYTEQRKIN